ncbi:MAG: aldo/keto reductase [Pseudobutyrivibrio sp.]|nr:aldo/keto reductase [Pseudobutyrivibrio sp.]
MQYRKFKDQNEISLLGFGCMRFTKKGNSMDIDKATKEIKLAYEGGVNYYDTAYVYGSSEETLGTALKTLGIRDKVYIATKLPHYLIKSVAGAERIFQEELHRLQTDYIDYYLMHMLTDTATWEKLCEIGIKDWIEDKIKSGQIKHIGFSYHGKSDEFKKIIDAYDWDFAQIQYNYMDEFSQAGVEGLKYAAGKNIPIVIMEGLRGGRLVELLPNSAKQMISDFGTTPAALAFKWLYNQPEVTCVLSGMNSLEMVEENLRTAEIGIPGCLTDEESSLIKKIKEEINKTLKVGCTGCGYCMPCPQGVDIPGTFSCYNKIYSEGRAKSKREYLQATTYRKNPSSASLCIGCGKCEIHCPQHLPIRQELKNAVRELETTSYKIKKAGIRLLHLWG